MIMNIDYGLTGLRVFRSKFPFNFRNLTFDWNQILVTGNTHWNGYVNWTKCRTFVWFPYRGKKQQNFVLSSCWTSFKVSKKFFFIQTLNGLHSFFHYISTSWSISFICSLKQTTNRNETELRKFITKMNKTNIDKQSIKHSVQKYVYVSKVPPIFGLKKKKKNQNQMRYIFLSSERPIDFRSLVIASHW